MVVFQQLIKEVSAQCLVCGKKNPLLQTEDCSKCLALARGLSLPAGIAGVANYSADGFIAIFFMGPGLFFLCSQGIPYSQSCLPLSCWVFSGLLIKNRLAMVTEQKSERHWQAKQVMILQL